VRGKNCRPPNILLWALDPGLRRSLEVLIELPSHRVEEVLEMLKK
jgi:hypothetical protein